MSVSLGLIDGSNRAADGDERRRHELRRQKSSAALPKKVRAVAQRSLRASKMWLPKFLFLRATSSGDAALGKLVKHVPHSLCYSYHGDRHHWQSR